MQRAKVLIIEDNEGDVDLVREVLEDRVELTWCASAREALEEIERSEFDLILLDQGLPDSNGLALLSDLVAARPDCSIVMLTGREDPTLALSALEIGAKRYLIKSEILEHLRPTVERLLSVDFAEPMQVGGRFMDTAEGFYPVLLETISEGCLVFDEDGIITFANGAAQAFTKASQSLLGTPILDLFAEGTRGRMVDALERLRQSEGPFALKFDARIQSKGSELPVRISMRSLQDGGTLRNGLLIATDMSEQVRIQELRDDVVRAMLHDLRTPLQAIYSSVAFLDDIDLSAEEEEARDCLSVIGLGTQQLLALVDQSLDIERFESGELPLSRSRTDLADHLDAAVKAQGVLTPNEAPDIVCAIKTDEPVGWFDSKLIGRVIQNLLGNAIRYTPRGEKIVAELERTRKPWANGSSGDGAPPADRDWLRVSVTDRGPGVSPEIAGRIFNKFVRGRNGGSGLGLTFCKIVVDAHGGAIWFEAGEPKGTRFIFEIPAQPLDGAEAS